MYKKFVIGIVFVLMIVCLSGCTEQKEDKQIDVETIENSFLSTVRDIGDEFKDISDVKSYNSTQYLQHKEKLNSYNTSLLDDYSEYAGSYTQLKNYLILGLEYITIENWENAWKNILYASGELFDVNTNVGDMWEIDVGLDNLKDILNFLKG